jgi:hypothetical protein
MYQTNEDDAFDERGLLKDGHVARVRMSMRDAMREHERARITDAFGRRPGNRPGFLISGANADAKRRAYADYERDLANRWRDQDEDDDPPNGPPAGSYPYRPEAEGGACTINGRPGRLVKQGDWLICRPLQSFNGSANSDQDEPALDPEMAASDADTMRKHKAKMQDEYSRYDRQLREAWRRRG